VTTEESGGIVSAACRRMDVVAAVVAVAVDVAGVARLDEEEEGDWVADGVPVGDKKGPEEERQRWKEGIEGEGCLPEDIWTWNLTN
jgi:hypothetical protein